ncbi:hypothetical protein GCM10009839_07770 [Catenulispora yoronensis]|uniref:Baseplate assembly protein n=1 Tax=Catenulispora yoronensis TaxID=450799 RepID=A0ABP5F2T7_9ACTN
MTADRLYDLLPSVVRRRDAEQGWPLRALVGIVQEQADIVEADIEQLYDDWFIETCQSWVAPYLGDLVGYRVLPGSAEALSGGAQDSDTEAAARLLTAIAGRRDVAHTVGNRRRKGTLALLEDLAEDVAAWPARAVEFRTLLGVTQAVRLYGHDPRADVRRRSRGRTADLRDGDALDRVDGPFDALAHTVDVRRVTAAPGRTPGRYDIPEVGLFVWRLRAYPVTHAPAYCDDRSGAHFTFSILGNSAPLITKPVPEPSRTHIADEGNVPAFIRRRAFADRTAQYYGPGKSLCVYVGGDPVPLNRIVPADLTGWAYRPKDDEVAIDPVLGRIAFSPRHAPEDGVWVDYHYGFSDDVGGGEYIRPLDPRSPKAFYTVGKAPGNDFDGLGAALQQWQTDKTADPAKRDAVIELTDAGDFLENPAIELGFGDRLTIRAAQGTRPVLRIVDWTSNRPDALHVTGPAADDGDCADENPADENSADKKPADKKPADKKPADKNPADKNPADACVPPRLVLDGLLITGRGVQVTGQVGQVVIRHSTLVPGWLLDQLCRPEHAEEPSIKLVDTGACLEIDRSIVGSIVVDVDEVHTEPLAIWVTDSVLDAVGTAVPALSAPDCRPAHAVFNARRTTVFGTVLTSGVGLVENTIVDGDLRVDHRQTGCVRFTWLGPGSRTPHRYHCLPPDPAPGQPQAVVPRFTSAQYGMPGYAQLARSCPEAIRRGADDGSELGVFHDLFQPQREDNLTLRLAESVPAGCDAAVIVVT